MRQGETSLILKSSSNYSFWILLTVSINLASHCAPLWFLVIFFSFNLSAFCRPFLGVIPIASPSRFFKSSINILNFFKSWSRSITHPRKRSSMLVSFPLLPTLVAHDLPTMIRSDRIRNHRQKELKQIITRFVILWENFHFPQTAQWCYTNSFFEFGSAK